VIEKNSGSPYTAPESESQLPGFFRLASLVKPPRYANPILQLGLLGVWYPAVEVREAAVCESVQLTEQLCPDAIFMDAQIPKMGALKRQAASRQLLPGLKSLSFQSIRIWRQRLSRPTRMNLAAKANLRKDYGKI
jgi:CheY-like chemotaxis protein